LEEGKSSSYDSKMSDAPADSALDIRLLEAAPRHNHAKRCLEEEITALFEQWRPALLRYLSTFELAHCDAEEIVQEVFLALFSHLQKDKKRTNLRGWLFRVAHNLTLKQRNAERRAVVITTDIDALPYPDLSPEEWAAGNQTQQRLFSVLRALPEQDRRCLYLRAEGLRYREIAEVLGISLGSVAASLERSLARFQRANRK
jgi:RNA polymerase sigma-70 factor, ECF subfamily